MKLREAIIKAHERGVKWSSHGWFTKDFSADDDPRCCLLGAAAMGCDPTLTWISGGLHVREILGLSYTGPAEEEIISPVVNANDNLINVLYAEWLDKNPANPTNEWYLAGVAERNRIRRLTLLEVMEELDKRDQKIKEILDNTEVCNA